MKRSALRIPNLRNSADKIHSSMFSLVALKINKFELNISEKEISDLSSQIQDELSLINKHCKKRLGSPADLSTPSFRIFLWLVYLSHQSHLSLHLTALDDFLRILIDQNKKMRVDVPRVFIKINYSGYLYRQHTSQNQQVLQINEAFITAPLQIKRFILLAAFSRHSSRQIQAIKAYSTTTEFRGTVKSIVGDPIANRISCRGRRYDLSVLFHKLNREYFHDNLSQPRLVWSSRSATRRLGYYHPEINTIAIAKRLDDKKIPRMLIEYILYHEMLHQFFGIKNHNGRRYAHTSAFRKAEKQFKHQKEAENLIKQI